MQPAKDIQFNLWGVLAGMMIIGASVCSILYADQREVRIKQQDVIQRIVKLEANLCYIAEGIRELKDGQKEVMSRMEETKRALDKKEKQAGRQ